TTTRHDGFYSFGQLHPGEATLSFAAFDGAATTWLGGGTSLASARWIELDENLMTASQQLVPRTFSRTTAFISGNPRVGQKLFAGADALHLETRLAWQWLADGAV